MIEKDQAVRFVAGCRAWHRLVLAAFPAASALILGGVALAAIASPVLVDISVENREPVLAWTDLGPGAAYTVESVDALGTGTWLPVPASILPTPALSWRDPRLLQARTRLYRVFVSMAPVSRGRLISAEPVRALSPADVAALFTQAGIPLPAGSSVRAYRLVYETVNPFDLGTIASGLLIVPGGSTNALPLVSYQHGTITLRDSVPSAMEGLETLIGIALGTSGYAAVLPDYLGLGQSPGLHPFVHAHTEATAAIDLLRAARAFCATNDVKLSGQLFLMGYSQGGHATMALHREIESYYTNEFTITASAPMAGPYCLASVMVDDFLSERTMPNPYYFLYLLAAYESIYGIADSLADVLASPYDARLPALLDGQHDGGSLNQAMGSAVPSTILKPEFLNAFRKNPNHPMRLALRENDVSDWTPRAPMHLYHCAGDQDILIANSQIAYDNFLRRGAAQVQLIDPFSQLDHGTCAPISLLAAKIWFDSFLPSPTHSSPGPP